MFYVFSKKCSMDFWLFSFVMVLLSYGGLKPLKMHQIWVIFVQKMGKKKISKNPYRTFFRNYWEHHLCQISGQSNLFSRRSSNFCRKSGYTFLVIWGHFWAKFRSKILKNQKKTTKKLQIWIGINKYYGFIES